MATNSDLRVRKGQSRRPADHARRLIGAVIRDAREPIRFSSVRLTEERSAVAAQANLELPGRNLSVRAEASTPAEAIDLLADRLDLALRDVRSHRAAPLCSVN